MNIVLKTLLCVAGIMIVYLSPAQEKELVGHWKLKGDSKDHSGNNNHGINHGVDLKSGTFKTKGAYIEVPNSPSLQFGNGDFSLSLWVYTEKDIQDIVGDVMEKYDPSRRKGFTLSINAGGSGYQGHGDENHVYFGIDNNRPPVWEMVGRPNPTSNYVSNSLTVYKGKLYAGYMDAKDKKDWAHVYRYEGGQKWTDCGRLGNGKTMGVLPMIVHNGDLYAATATYDWTRVEKGDYDEGHVYRYKGGTEWEDVGVPPGNSKLMNGIACYQGKLYIGGGPYEYGIYEYDGKNNWTTSTVFPKSGPGYCWPHPMRTYRGKMYVAYASAFSFDGNKWTEVGYPSKPWDSLQTHSFTIHQGSLVAGTFPWAKVAKYMGGDKWEDLPGRVGEDGTEVGSLVVYNGKLYAGSIPRAELCRFDETEFTSLRRFYSPEGWTPVAPWEHTKEHPANGELFAWSRITAMTVYDGKLFAGIGSCTATLTDAPVDTRGSVYTLEAGKNLSYDEDLGTGWKHLVVVREGRVLKMYIDGKKVKQTEPFDGDEYDISNDKPLLLGFGQNDYFTGRMRDVRVYKKALSDPDAQRLFSMKP